MSSNPSTGKTLATAQQPHPVPDEVSQSLRDLDRQIHSHIGQAFSGLSPIQGGLVYLNWLLHWSISPGKQLDVARQTLQDVQQACTDWLPPIWRPQAPSLPSSPASSATLARPDSVPLQESPPTVTVPTQAHDKRFKAPEWSQWPFNVYAESFLIMEHAWDRATHGVPGVNQRSENIASFAARQWLDFIAPSNVPWLNPEVLSATQKEGGLNWVRGAHNWVDDYQRLLRDLPPVGAEQYEVGVNVAITPGEVVYRNDLMELIQYTPTTDKVHAEPILIVPAWIMKYYILDLSPGNSLVKYLVDQGHTVFMVSWKNPTAHDRDKGMEDYRRDGVMQAINTVSEIVPKQKIHAVGYCLGGTILMIAAAAMGRDHDMRLASMTLFAAQGDFTEAGELLLFINESEVDLIEAMMWEQGVLKGSQMAGTFQMLRTNDLVWSRILKEYMLGQREGMNDLMAWNADTTRMPYKMHSEYLRKLFLCNDLASGRYEVDGQPVWFTDIRVPCFAVGTVSDHVAPWKSVYKLHLLPVELTFVLTSGGHNAGIVSEPGHPHRHFQIQNRPAGGDYLSPEAWQAQTPSQDGSWWPAWQRWLADRSSGLVPPPKKGKPRNKMTRMDAPGSYVREH